MGATTMLSIAVSVVAIVLTIVWALVRSAKAQARADADVERYEQQEGALRRAKQAEHDLSADPDVRDSLRDRFRR